MAEETGKLETKFYRLEKLVKWDRVSEVNDMLLQGIAPAKISEWCKAVGFSISPPKLYEYKELLQKSIAQQVTVERLLGVGAPKRTPIVLQALGIEDAKNFVKAEMEVLDLIIQRGYSDLLRASEVKVQDVMKAIELKNKITGGAHGGLTGYGVDQLREIEERKFEAIIGVVKDYIPEDKLPELQARIEEAERKFYEEYAPEYAEEYDARVQETIDGVQDVIVSDTGY